MERNEENLPQISQNDADFGRFGFAAALFVVPAFAYIASLRFASLRNGFAATTIANARKAGRIFTNGLVRN